MDKLILKSCQFVFPNNPERRYVFKLTDKDAKELVEKYISAEFNDTYEIKVEITIEKYSKP